jgi:hypothetical protein
MAAQTRNFVLAVIVMVAGGIGFYVWKQHAGQPERATPAAAPPAAVPPIAAPASSLSAESSEANVGLAAEIAGGLGLVSLPEFVNTDGLLRRVVASVDALSRDQLPLGVRVIRPVAGAFAARGGEGNPRVAPENAARYAPIADAFEHVPPAAAGELYRRLYPRLQAAYEELGYPGRSFHARLLEVIDHLLATPDVPDGAALARPKVLYLYADPQLERCSSGQKALMRSGALNEARFKAHLRLIRAELAIRPPR